MWIWSCLVSHEHHLTSTTLHFICLFFCHLFALSLVRSFLHISSLLIWRLSPHFVSSKLTTYFRSGIVLLNCTDPQELPWWSCCTVRTPQFLLQWFLTLNHIRIFFLWGRHRWHSGRYQVCIPYPVLGSKSGACSAGLSISHTVFRAISLNFSECVTNIAAPQRKHKDTVCACTHSLHTSCLLNLKMGYKYTS